MRLIDADAFFNEFSELKDYEFASQEYEVEAIPIEWIKSWTDRSENTYYRDQVLSMMKDWENENEVD